MKYSTLAVGLLGILAITASPTRAEETYDLRGPAPQKGMILRDSMIFSMPKADITIDLGGGNKITGVMDMTSTTIKREEILAVDGRDITKLRTKLEKDESVRKTTIEKKTETENDKKALEGELIYSEKTKNGWKHSLEDTKPTEKQAKELKDFDDPENDDDLYPADKVAVGKEWNIDAKAFKKIVGSKMSDAKGTASGKFLRLEKYEGQMCAVIETTIDISARLKQEDSDFKIQMKGKIISYRSLAEGVDLKFTIDGTAKFSGTSEQDGTKFDLEFSGKMRGEGTTKIVKN